MIKAVREQLKSSDLDRQMRQLAEKSWQRVEVLEKRLMDFYEKLLNKQQISENGIKFENGKIEKIAGDIVDERLKSFRNALEGFVKNVKEEQERDVQLIIEAKMSVMYEKISGLQSRVEEGLSRFYDEMKRNADDFSTMNEKFSDAFRALEEKMREIKVGFTSHIEQINETLNANLKSMNTGLTGLKMEAAENLKKVKEEIREDFERKVQGIFSVMREGKDASERKLEGQITGIKKDMEAYIRQIEGSMEKKMQPLYNHLEKFFSWLNDTVNEKTEEISRAFGEKTDSLGSEMNAMKEKLDACSKNIGELSTNIVPLRAEITDLKEESAANLNRAREEIKQDFNRKIEAVSLNLKETIGGNFEVINGKIDDTQNRLVGLFEELKGVVSSKDSLLVDRLDESRESYSKSLEKTKDEIVKNFGCQMNDVISNVKAIENKMIEMEGRVESNLQQFNRVINEEINPKCERFENLANEFGKNMKKAVGRVSSIDEILKEHEDKISRFISDVLAKSEENLNSQWKIAGRFEKVFSMINETKQNFLDEFADKIDRKMNEIRAAIRGFENASEGLDMTQRKDLIGLKNALSELEYELAGLKILNCQWNKEK